MISINPVSGAIGAVIGNIDLTQPLEKRTVDEIKAALLEYCVLFFRDQNLKPENHISFSECFGGLNIDKFVKGPDNYPKIMSVIKEPENERGFAGMWHSDVTFLDKPETRSISTTIEFIKSMAYGALKIIRVSSFDY